LDELPNHGWDVHDRAGQKWSVRPKPGKPAH
jgi:hypothetical protein